MARYKLSPEDVRLWSLVTATVRPHRAVRTVAAPPEIETVKLAGMPDMVAEKPRPVPLTPFRIGQEVRPHTGFRLVRAAMHEPDPIEPRRKRRISRERDPIEARLDLHGMTAIAAEARLKAFVEQAYANDYRAVLVITGKGVAETGILKRFAPEWLAAPELAHIVAGISPAHAKHGGAGALYVALKRRT
jgi:DNA-nicking Smr family endonuclease